MEKNKAFTILEVLISLALFALVAVMLMSIFDFAASSTTETERAAEAVSNCSATKELLVKSISPSTSIEILPPTTENNLTTYTTTNGDDDKKYIYLYSIDGVVYYRNPGDATVGKEIKAISETDVDLGFEVKNDSTRKLDVDMTFTTKEVEPYVLDEVLSVIPLNLAKDAVIKDSRTDKNTPSNIIRYVSDEIIMNVTTPVDDETPIIISATVYNVPVKDTPSSTNKVSYNVPFYVSQKPKTIQVYNYSSLADQGSQIKTEETINNTALVAEENRADFYFKNTVIQQSTFLANLTKPQAQTVVTFVFKGNYFEDYNGTKYGEEFYTKNENGTNTINYIIPKEVYEATGKKFTAISKNGARVSYDFKVTSGLPKPEIIRFEFLPEDNNIPYKLKTYINENDVYYTKYGTWPPEIPGTEGASRPLMYNYLWLGNQNIEDKESFYSTIVMPTNRSKIKDDYYPALGQYANVTDKNSDKYLHSRVATITFRGTSIIFDGVKVTVPEPERTKLNGVDEVTVKVSIDKKCLGDVKSLDGEKYEDVYKGTEFETYEFPAYTSTNTTDTWFDTQNDMDLSYQQGQGHIFTVLNGNEAKRYTYQHEASTTKPDYHQGSTADSGLNRVWVDGYMEGAWVGGSMRGDVSGDIVVKVPYEDYDKIKNNIVLKMSAYGKSLIQLPSYKYGTFSGKNATKSTDNYSYYALNNNIKSEITLPTYSAAPDASIRYNADYLSHFVLLQDTRAYGPLVRYQVRIEKSYDSKVLEPELESVAIYRNKAENSDKNFTKSGGAFVVSSDMAAIYNVGDEMALNVAFAGSKIKFGTSIDPDACKEYTRGINNQDAFYETRIDGCTYGTNYIVHVYDYEGKWKEAYRIITKDTKVRTTTVYDLNEEMARDITNPTSTKQPFLPVKTDVAGVSYGYQDSNSGVNLIETPVQLTPNIKPLIENYYDPYGILLQLNNFASYLNLPLPYIEGTTISGLFTYAPRNLGKYTLVGQNKTISNDLRMFIRSIKTDYTKGGPNLNVAAQYNITNFMTPVLINKDHLMFDYGAKWMSPSKYNTDNWVGTGTERPNFIPSNVKLDQTGFSVQIFNDRVYNQKLGTAAATTRSVGRPGAVAETTYDIAIVDTTTDSFNTESYHMLGSGENNNTDIVYTDDLPHDNSPQPKSIKTNDVLGYGFSLIEQNVDREPAQNYLGTGTPTKPPVRADREVALMFYVRHFVASGEGTGVDLAKLPGTYVKIADLKGFNMDIKNSTGTDLLNSQAVNFKVDVVTTFNGTTTINESNYESIMKNEYIGFTVTELDIEGNPTGKTHFKMYPFADVFGGVRIDDDYNALNLILNHRSRVITKADGTLDTTPRPVRLSVGYGTNWGLVGISDFKIVR